MHEFLDGTHPRSMAARTNLAMTGTRAGEPTGVDRTVGKNQGRSRLSNGFLSEFEF
jgi:hypothetical protein